MNDLIKRLRKLAGPDRELDARIAAYLDLRPEWAKGDAATMRAYESKYVTGAWCIELGKNGPGIDFLPFTHSIDAAVTLVPENAAWIARNHNGRANHDGEGKSKKAFANVHGWPSDCALYPNWAATPAIALCAAALEYRAALSSTK